MCSLKFDDLRECMRQSSQFHFLPQKFGRKVILFDASYSSMNTMTVIVLIDGCETSNNRAYEHSYSNEVFSLYPSLWLLRLRASNPGQCVFQARNRKADDLAAFAQIAPARSHSLSRPRCHSLDLPYDVSFLSRPGSLDSE